MGRKRSLEKPKKGPGRRARKQPPPTLPGIINIFTKFFCKIEFVYDYV